MFLPLAALSAVAVSPPPAKVERQARATITILQAHRASRQTWDPAARSGQREIVKKEADGSEIRLRLTEFE